MLLGLLDLLIWHVHGTIIMQYRAITILWLLSTTLLTATALLGPWLSLVSCPAPFHAHGEKGSG